MVRGQRAVLKDTPSDKGALLRRMQGREQRAEGRGQNFS